jgi:rhomboid-like protein
MCIGSAAYFYLLGAQNKYEVQQQESTSSYHFLAFFISGKPSSFTSLLPSFFNGVFFCAAGLFSSLVSHVVNVKFRYPKIVAHLASPASTVQRTENWAGAVAASSPSAVQAVAVKKIPPILPSLGASGAIYATATMTALAFPEAQTALFFPPTYPISIQYGIGGLMIFDAIGILRGWRSVLFFFPFYLIFDLNLNT